MWFSCFALTSRSSSPTLRFWCCDLRCAPSLPPRVPRRTHPHLTALVPLQQWRSWYSALVPCRRPFPYFRLEMQEGSRFDTPHSNPWMPIPLMSLQPNVRPINPAPILQGEIWENSNSGASFCYPVPHTTRNFRWVWSCHKLFYLVRAFNHQRCPDPSESEFTAPSDNRAITPSYS